MERKYALFLSGLLFLFACKKENLDDPAVYKWERQLVQVTYLVNPVLPLNGQEDNKRVHNPWVEVVVKRETVFLTNAAMAQQRDSINSTSRGTYIYKYFRQ